MFVFPQMADASESLSDELLAQQLQEATFHHLPDDQLTRRDLLPGYKSPFQHANYNIRHPHYNNRNNSSGGTEDNDPCDDFVAELLEQNPDTSLHADILAQQELLAQASGAAAQLDTSLTSFGGNTTADDEVFARQLQEQQDLSMQLPRGGSETFNADEELARRLQEEAEHELIGASGGEFPGQCLVCWLCICCADFGQA